MAVNYIPYNPQTDVWAQLGGLAGGLMRENYDQRGANKVLEYMQDQKNYLANQQAQQALQDWGNARTGWETAQTPEEKKAHEDAGKRSRDVLQKLGYGGLTGETTPEQTKSMMEFSQKNMADLLAKYRDPNRAGMPSFDTSQNVSTPGRMFDIKSIPQVYQAPKFYYSTDLLNNPVRQTPTQPMGFGNKVVW